MSFPMTGTVYGTLMNFRGEHEALAASMNEPPYKAPPKAPVLYVKPANTWTPDGGAVPLPAAVPEVEIGASIAVVMRSPHECAGYVLMNDFSIPHASFFRPPVRFKCLDGFLGVGARVVAKADAPAIASAVLEVRVNGALVQTVRFADLVRPESRLLADVAEFMTLGAGDALMLGCDAGRPRARVGDRIEIRAQGLGTLTNTLVPEAA